MQRMPEVETELLPDRLVEAEFVLEIADHLARDAVAVAGENGLPGVRCMIANVTPPSPAGLGRTRASRYGIP